MKSLIGRHPSYAPGLSTAALALTLALVAPGAVGCVTEPEANGRTPIQEMLAQDSARRALGGDSVNRHIGLDYENYNRDTWQKPGAVLDRLGDLAGKTVVEVGSGKGYFTRRLAERAARVLALDISPELLITLDSLNASELDSATYGRITPRLVVPNDPGLGRGEADAAILVNTFMYIQEGAGYLAALRRGLKPGGTVVIVDFKTARTPFGPPLNSRLPAAVVEEALRDAGFVDIRTDEALLDYQYLVSARVE